jgi:hypothetical protein
MKRPVLECTIRLQRETKGAQHLVSEPRRAHRPMPGRVPRLVRLLALAHKFEELVRQGTIADYATLARLGQVSRARVTQIMNLLQLAPDIQEQILFLPPTLQGRDPLFLRQLQPIAQALDWQRQRALWRKLLADNYPQLLTSSPGTTQPIEVTALVAGSAATLRGPAKARNAGKSSSTLTTTAKEHHGQV